MKTADRYKLTLNSMKQSIGTH